MNQRSQLRAEMRLLARDYAFWGLILLLFFLMAMAIWNTHQHFTQKKLLLEKQLDLVQQNDRALMAQIDSLSRGLATYEDQYTSPTSGVRLTYNNHRIALMPAREYALLAIGQGDLFSNYRKIVLYFNDSYERKSEELASPVEQFFGRLDVAFVWTYLLPLIILLSCFNTLSIERETGRLKLIAAQPIKLSNWLLLKIGLRFCILYSLIVIFSFILLLFFGVSIVENPGEFMQLLLILFLYVSFWFFLSFLVNQLGFNSGRSLILLTNLWVVLVFLIPSAINQFGRELHPLPTRLEIINHHQQVYNEMEAKFDEEMENLFRLHPDWASTDRVTKDMSNSTGWNINFLAKQYIAQLKHQPMALAYEDKVDERNQWLSQFSGFSPAMIFQSALTDLAGTSTRYYRSFLQQSQDYAHVYRQYVFKRLFTNHAFTAEEIQNLPTFTFDRQSLPSLFGNKVLGLFIYILLIGVTILTLARKNTLIF